jgi:hypothetical protein
LKEKHANKSSKVVPGAGALNMEEIVSKSVLPL